VRRALQRATFLVVSALAACAAVAIGPQSLRAEVCDGLDDDGDGQTDEDYVPVRNGAVTPCDGGDDDACIQGGHYTCREDGAGVECVTDGAIASFRFEEGAGTEVSTSSGRVTTPYATPPRVGTVSGATWTLAGHPDGRGGASRALLFDGVDDYVDVPHHPTLDVTGALTLEAWIWPTAGAGRDWRLVGGLYTGGAAGWFLAVNFTQGPGFAAWFGAACGWKDSDVVPPLDAWTHVAATYDGATARLFVDGAKVHESDCTGNGGALAPSSSPLHIGGLGAWNPSQAPFAGAIDDFAVYDVALSESQVASRARSGERCDGLDNDCDGLVDDVLYPGAGDGRSARKGAACDGPDRDRCVHGTYTCAPGALAVECANESPFEIPETCDELDNDCDGALPPDEHDDDSDTFLVCEGDCDDGSAALHPLAIELCDGLDGDCDGALPVQEQDLDGDGHLACVPGERYDAGDRLQWADCEDGDATIHEGAPELCDAVDDDCDGLTDQLDPNCLAPRIHSWNPIGVFVGSLDPRDLGTPAYGPQRYIVTIRGRNFTRADVTTFSFGPGVAVDAVELDSSQQLRVTITVDAVACPPDGSPARLGPRDIVMRMGTCTVTLAEGFELFAPNAWFCAPALTDAGLAALAALFLVLGLRALRRRRTAAAA